MTDQEIMDVIKRDVIDGETSDSLVLEVYIEGKPPNTRTFSEYMFDQLFMSLFDWSLSKRIVKIEPRRTMLCCKSYNGNNCPVIGYTFTLEESPDGQTNITPKLMWFIEVVFSKWGLDKLAYPSGRYQISEMSCMNEDGVFRHEAIDPWEEFESQLEEDG